MKQPKKENKRMGAKYDAALIIEADALNLAEVGKDAYKCELDGLYYTYEDFAVDTSTPHTMVEVDDDQNDEMFQLEWNGSLPVTLKRKKMFPR